MSNQKFLAKEDGWLYGPIMIDKPVLCTSISDDIGNANQHELHKQYEQHLASLPKFCRHEGLSGIVEEGKDFELQECNISRKCSSGHILLCHDKGCQHPIAVPLSPKQGKEKFGWLEEQAKDIDLWDNAVGYCREQGLSGNTFQIAHSAFIAGSKWQQEQGKQSPPLSAQEEIWDDIFDMHKVAGFKFTTTMEYIKSKYLITKKG